MNKYMKHIVKGVIGFLPFCFFTFSPQTVYAQKFTDQLRQSNGTQGKVTVTQSPEIEELVNGKPKPAETPAAPQDNKQPAAPHDDKQPAAPANKPATTPANKPVANATQPNNQQTTSPARQDTASVARDDAKKRKVVGYENNNVTTEDGTTIVDTRKKVMRNAQKVTGYRIQAYAGGNTRADRVKAEQAGTKLKNAFPEQPIYVHFYSPRWICRMGNFRNYNDAAKLLKQVKSLGYPQACIVKGKITVQY